MIRNLGALAFVLFAAWMGYQAFKFIGFPTAPLTGSAAAVTLVALAGLNVDLPVSVRNFIILILGANIGTAVTPTVLQGAILWPISLGILAVCVMAGLALSAWVLQRLFGFDRGTAVLASAPGHLSYVLTIAAETGRDVPAIAIIQTIRVLFLTLIVPPIITLTFGGSGVSFAPDSVMDVGAMLGLLVVSVPVALLLSQIKVPAAWLIAGMIVSAVAHGADITPGGLPPAVSNAALVFLGALIGSRFAAAPAKVVMSYVLPGLVLTSLVIGVALAGVVIAVFLTGHTPALLIVAFAPGGVEAMAAIALSLGYNPAFVAAHHVFRLMVLSVLMPVISGRIGSSET